MPDNSPILVLDNGYYIQLHNLLGTPQFSLYSPSTRFIASVREPHHPDLPSLIYLKEHGILPDDLLICAKLMASIAKAIDTPMKLEDIMVTLQLKAEAKI